MTVFVALKDEEGHVAHVNPAAVIRLVPISDGWKTRVDMLDVSFVTLMPPSAVIRLFNQAYIDSPLKT